MGRFAFLGVVPAPKPAGLAQPGKHPHIIAMITLRIGLPTGFDDAAAALYWQAFGAKLGTLLGPDARGCAFFAATLNPDAVIAAFDGDKLLGIAAFQEGGRGFSTAGAGDLFHHYGLGALWRMPLLALLERQSDTDTLQMDGICVADGARGQGVGTALFDALFDLARDRGYRRITLDVIDSNPRAKALYQRLGFQATGRAGTSFLRPILGFRHATRMVRAL